MLGKASPPDSAYSGRPARSGCRISFGAKRRASIRTRARVEYERTGVEATRRQKLSSRQAWETVGPHAPNSLSLFPIEGVNNG